MPRTAARRACLGVVMSTLLVVSGCGGDSEPEPLKAMEPEVPADLCATVPEAPKTGLVANSNTDTTGNPTAACSLRSSPDAKSEVRAVVTWVQLNDDVTADQVLDSQCRSIDRTEYKEQAGFPPEGADKACAASGTVDGADSATMAAASGREVVTVRLARSPPGAHPAIARAQQMLEGVLSSMAGYLRRADEQRPCDPLAPADVGPGPRRGAPRVDAARAVLRPVLRGRRRRRSRDACTTTSRTTTSPASPGTPMVFFAIWWAWVNYSWFASAYDSRRHPASGCSPSW